MAQPADGTQSVPVGVPTQRMGTRAGLITAASTAPTSLRIGVFGGIGAVGGGPVI